ncbi:MAG TPA: MarR family transcriptional regulator [Bacillus sp. (in: Bacteria)]|nr:MarR family transcriptional regulator [Bacillus sp. (in: firmicutes)]
MSKIVSFEEAEKKAKSRENQIENFLEQANIGLSSEQQQMLLQILHSTTGDSYFIGKKKKPSDRVKFVQIIIDNITYLIDVGYLSSNEEAFLFKLTSCVEFKTNVLIDRENNCPASPTYLAEKFKMARQSVSRIMNGLLKKGILAVAQTGMTTEDGRVCTSRTWFVNPNIMCCSPKDGIDKATQHIFRDSLKNFKVDAEKKKHKLPIYLF